jgi:D-3-phosphoglycerate dehydrogenase
MPARPRILVTESHRFSPDAAAVLARAGDPVLADLDRAGLLREAAGADVLWVRLRHQIDAEVLDAAPRLRAIVTPTTGLNHVDVAEAERRGIAVLSLRGEEDFLRDVRATAEHTIGLMLALLRHVPDAAWHVQDGGWDRDRFRGRELHRSTVGVLGYGRLGRIVARYLAAFDATVLVCDPHRSAADVEAPARLVGQDELLERSRILTLHVNLEPATEGLVGRPELHRLPPGAFLVNTARGELIDEAALLDVLQSGRLAGAALDVLAGEQASGMAGHPLVEYAREHPNLLITPHIGGATYESMETTERFMAEKLVSTLDTDR